MHGRRLWIRLASRLLNLNESEVMCSIIIRNPINRRGKMNVFELLKEDHKKVSQIFEKLEPTTEQAVKTRDELFAKLKNELEIHTRIEETIFYPVLKEAAETRAIT